MWKLKEEEKKRVNCLPFDLWFYPPMRRSFFQNENYLFADFPFSLDCTSDTGTGTHAQHFLFVRSFFSLSYWKQQVNLNNYILQNGRNTMKGKCLSLSLSLTRWMAESVLAKTWSTRAEHRNEQKLNLGKMKNRKVDFFSFVFFAYSPRFAAWCVAIGANRVPENQIVFKYFDSIFMNQNKTKTKRIYHQTKGNDKSIANPWIHRWSCTMRALVVCV